VGFTEMTPDLSKIRLAGVHLLNLINQILDLSKVEADKMELFVESFDLDALINDVAATVLPLVGKNNNQLIIESDRKLGCIQSDALKVRQILFNLVSNAAKFTDNGTITVMLRMEEIGEHAGVKISIKDTGIGLTHDQLDHIFQPFAQADNSTTRKYGGTGLGLSITQRFCTMLGGEMNVVSEPGEGSMFTVWLRTNVGDGDVGINAEANVGASSSSLNSTAIADLKKTG
jgi:signal transduction histidine kinase